MAFTLLNWIRRLPKGSPISPIEHDRRLDNVYKNFQLLNQEIEIATPRMSVNGGLIVKMYTGPLSDLGWVGGTFTAVPDISYRAWSLCDGNSFNVPGIGNVSVPDFDGLFPVGAGGTYAVGATGGTNDNNHNHGGSSGGHALEINEIPDHTHDGNDTVVNGPPNEIDGLDAASLSKKVDTTTTGGITGHTGVEEHDHSIEQQLLDNRPPFRAIHFIAYVGYVHS